MRLSAVLQAWRIEMTTTVINLHTKENGKSGYKYYKQKYGDRFVYIGCEIDMFNTHIPGSDWCNPHHTDIKKLGREEVIVRFAEDLLKNKSLLRRLYDGELSDKVLGCWCVEKEIDYVRRDKVCHGEVLLQWVGMSEEWHDMSPEEALKRKREVSDDIDLLGRV